jgi:hypothetical protein
MKYARSLTRDRPFVDPSKSKQLLQLVRCGCSGGESDVKQKHHREVCLSDVEDQQKLYTFFNKPLVVENSGLAASECELHVNG